MHETAEDLARLQHELDESYAAAGEHVRSIFRPQRRLSAEELGQTLKGVFVLQVAPVGAVRIAHLRARPQVSATYTRGEEVCVMVQGTARAMREGDPLHADYIAYCRETYGEALWDYWSNQHYKDRPGEDFTAWIEPRRVFAMGPDPGDA